MRAEEFQARLHICAVSPGFLQIALKRRDVDEGSVKMYKPVQESLVLNAYASSESNGRDVDERSGQNFRASLRKFSTSHIYDQRRPRRACTFIQYRVP